MSHGPEDSAPSPVEVAGSVFGRAEAALEAGDFATVTAVLQERLIELATIDLQRLEALLLALPPECLEAHPQAAAMRFGISTFLDQDQPGPALDHARALRELAPQDSPLADRVVVGVGEIFALRAMGAHPATVAVVERDGELARAERAAWLELPGQLRSVTLLQWGLSRMLSGDLEGATAHFQEAYWAGRRCPVPHFARNGAENAALMLALVDSLDEAAEWLDKARSIPPAPEALRSYVEDFVPLVEATIALARLDVPEARRALDAFVPSPDTRLSWSVEAYLGARLHLLTGERYAGLDELDRARPPRGGDVVPGSFDELLLRSVEAELAIAAGRAPRAARVLGQLPAHPLTGPARARHALMTGDATGALAISMAGLHEPATFGRLDLAAIAAVALVHLGRTSEAETQFGLAIELARSRGTRAPFVVLPRADVEALCALVPAGAELLGPTLASTTTSVERVDVVRLSARERLVLAELGRTGSVQQIADALFVSTNTIKSQLRSIYRKLDVSSRDAALAEALRLGFDLDVPS